MGIVLARIDNRLLHGIVATQWAGRSGAQRIMIIDDTVANNELTKASMKLARPTGMAISIITEETALNNFKAGKYNDHTVFVLVKKPETLVTEFKDPEDVKIFDGFRDMEEAPLKELYSSLNLAMTFKDFLHIQNYFKNEEKRDPSMTEIRVLDTYWSDHCRHTTFSTELTQVKFDEGDYKTPIVDTYNRYLSDREVLYKGRDDKFVCLMDLALMAMKKLKSEGKLQDQEESDEINACSIVVPVDVNGKEEEWLINFKNETHNHPTEIEPFGGAATCLGGAIRDPLSGRTYVYQAMRVTGAADPTVSVKETLKGKLPQKKLVRGAAHGYSS